MLPAIQTPYLSPLWRWSVHVPYWLSASCTRVSVSLASGGRLEKHCFSWSCRDEPDGRDFYQGKTLRTWSPADTDHTAFPHLPAHSNHTQFSTVLRGGSRWLGWALG